MKIALYCSPFLFSKSSSRQSRLLLLPVLVYVLLALVVVLLVVVLVLAVEHMPSLVQPLWCVLQGTDAGSERLPQRALARGIGVSAPSFRALFLRSNSPTSPAPVDLQTAPVCG